MTTLSTWNKFQHDNQGKGYTHVEMVKKFEAHKKKHHIKPSPRKSQRLEGFSEKHKGKFSEKELKSMYKQQQNCKELRKKLSPRKVK